MDELSVGQQQRVEILKALSRDCRILILDEPTAVLVPDEVNALFATLRSLVADGMSVVSSATSWRKCVPSATASASCAAEGWLARFQGPPDERELAGMMVGRPTFGVERPAEGAAPSGAPILRISDLNANGARLGPSRRSRSRRRWRRSWGSPACRAMAGTELVELLSGMREPTRGSIAVGRRRAGGADPTRCGRASGASRRTGMRA